MNQCPGARRKSLKRIHLGCYQQEEFQMKSYMANPAKIERKWYVVDADGQVLGRMAAQVASVLRGKNKPEFTPHEDVGGMKETTLREMMAKKPEKVVELAVKGMLPKGPLGRQMLKKLHVYAGPEHKQEAQKPEVLTLV